MSCIATSVKHQVSVFFLTRFAHNIYYLEDGWKKRKDLGYMLLL